MKKGLQLLLVTLIFTLCLAFHSDAQHDYDRAVGLKFGWGYGITGKFFMQDHVAIEGIVSYRSYDFGGLGSTYDYYWLRIVGLYEIHNPLDQIVEGLQWYYGGGAFFYSYGGDFDYPGSDFNSTNIGIAGVIGLDYKFANVPINISTDWVPGFAIVGGGGFVSEAGGFAIRYTF